MAPAADQPVSIGIVIPTWNEAAIIAETLERLLPAAEKAGGVEIAVSDSGTDATAEIASRYPVRVVRGAAGRARQMNAGAETVAGELLYFLHADTLPPTGFIDHLRHAHDAGKRAGCFRMRFDQRDPLLDLFGWCTRLPFTLCRGGDQSLFITRQLFAEIGGFDASLMVMEDIEILERIQARTAFHILEPEVTTSARKYRRHGILELQALFGSLHLLYALGVENAEIARWYRHNIG